MKRNMFNFTKEQRLVYLSMANNPAEAGREAVKPEETGEIHDEANQALDRLSRYREELIKRLDSMDKKNPKYKLFEKAYNDLTDIQEKLQKSIDESGIKKQEVIKNTFNRMGEIFKNPHLSIVRSIMIQKNLKEIKKSFSEEIGHLKADNVIPLISLMTKSKFGASVEDGKTYGVEGILVRRDGDNIKLFINGKLYEFSTKVVKGKWQFFDKNGKPLKDLSIKPDRSGAAGFLGGLDNEDFTQKLVQKKTEIKKGPALEKRKSEIPEAKKESAENKITTAMRNEEFADLHFNKTALEDSPILQQYLNSLKKSDNERFKAEIISPDGKKQNLAVIISKINEKGISYYRVSTAVNVPGTKTPESYKTEYWPKGAEKKQYTGTDPIAEKIQQNESEKKAEKERVEQNEKNFNVFRNEYKQKAIESFVRDIDQNDRPAETILAEMGIKPPFVSEMGRDIYGTRYWFTVENKNNMPSIKLELQRAEAGSIRYAALEKTGEYVAEINKEPAKMTNAEAEAIMLGKKVEKVKKNTEEKEWRNAALKAVDVLINEVKSNDAMKKFANKLIRANNIDLNGKTIENKTEIYKQYMDIAVSFRDKISVVKDNLQQGITPRKEIEDDLNKTIAILPETSQRQYLAMFNKDVEENIKIAREQVSKPEKPQA